MHDSGTINKFKALNAKLADTDVKKASADGVFLQMAFNGVGHPATAEIPLNLGARMIHKPDLGQLPLMTMMVLRRSCIVITSLLEHGADPNIRDSLTGRTCFLTLASNAKDDTDRSFGYVDILGSLIGFKTDVEAQNNKGNSILHNLAERK